MDQELPKPVGTKQLRVQYVTDIVDDCINKDTGLVHKTNRGFVHWDDDISEENMTNNDKS